MPLFVIVEIVPDVLPIPFEEPLIVPELSMEVMLELFDMPTLPEEIVPVLIRPPITPPVEFLIPYVPLELLLSKVPLFLKLSILPVLVIVSAVALAPVSEIEAPFSIM